ncbi:MAG: hypothetical protein ACKV19_15295 [Verrucomicrobiales bacterium]
MAQFTEGSFTPPLTVHRSHGIARPDVMAVSAAAEKLWIDRFSPMIRTGRSVAPASSLVMV